MEEELTPTGKVTKGTVLRLFLQVHRHKPTGNLYLKEGSLLRIFYFSKGRYAYGQSNIAGEKLAELIREEKALPEELLQDALSQQAAGEYLGRILLQKGYLTPLQLSSSRRESSPPPWNPLRGSTSFSTRSSPPR